MQPDEGLFTRQLPGDRFREQTDPVLQLENINVSFDGFRALTDLSLAIGVGELRCVIGPNGAGKTTIMKMLLGLTAPTSGTVSIFGRPLKGNEKRVLPRIGSLIESPGFYPNLTGTENLQIFARLRGLKSPNYIKGALELVNLPYRDKKRYAQYSLGMKQRLGIAIALAGDPDFLVLDEPVNGLDPQGIVEMRELILKLNRERQITVLISSHILDELSRLATHYGIIDNGRMVKELSAEELDAACRKCVRMEVSDTAVLARVLDAMNLEYKIISATTADVFAKINVTQLTVALAKENCEVLSMQEKDESLESYYISLVGGGSNA